MKNVIVAPRVIVRFVAKHWIGVVVIALMALVWAVGSPAWAATGPGDLYITVPPPLPTEPVILPTATSTSKNEDDKEQPNQPPPAEQPTPQPEVEDKLYGMVIPQALNVRSGPGTSFAVIGKLTISDTVEILNRDQTGSWWLICCTKPDERQGWVSAPLIRPDFDPARANELLEVAPELEANPTPTPTPTPQATAQPAEGATPVVQAQTSAPASTADGLIATVNADRLNLRNGPGTDFAIVAKLLRGESVEVLSRNGSGDWWYVCCAAGTTTEGWTSAPYLAPAFDRASANQLLPIFTAAPVTTTSELTVTTTISETDAATAALTATVAAGDTGSTSTNTTLAVEMQLAPAFAIQGQPVQIVMRVTNTGAVAASNVALRDELAPSLALVDGDASAAGLFSQETTESGAIVANFTWPMLNPGQQVTAILTVNLASDLADGSVVDNLAAVQADNTKAATTGVSIGLPPTAPPDFR